MSIDGINLLNYVQEARLNTDTAGINNKQVENSSFDNILSQAIDLTNATDFENQMENINLVSGEVNDLHSVIIAGEKADVALNLTVQIRNKVLDAYNEIMGMQI